MDKDFLCSWAVGSYSILINFFGTKERVKPAGAEEGEIEDVPFGTGIKALFKNKYWIMMTGIWLVRLMEFSMLFRLQVCSLSQC